jgi:fructan beta-fructosidase
MNTHRISFAVLLTAVLLAASFLATVSLPAAAQTLPPTGAPITMSISKHYLNIPVAYRSKLKLIQLSVGGRLQREFPVQLPETDVVDYWIYIDVSGFKGQKLQIAAPSTPQTMARIYQDDRINGADSLYKETNRPQFHFTVERGWSNDINGPIYYNGQYHLFWQAFPFGLSWNTGFMYWGHAISKDLLHWEEQAPALMLDSLGSPWSGTAVIDQNNDGGWGKNAMVLYYCCYDRVSFKQVQCIAYSTDNGKTFRHYSGNPVIDSNDELKTNDTRDPKVFWYQPAKTWVMVLFEKDGMSFYNSTDMKAWTRKSHFKGLFECPDFFELPVDGNASVKKWVIHGGSSEYFIGSFDGSTFTAESSKLRYAEGGSEKHNELLYAAESFENMPDNRRVQMAWGRIDHPGMPFTQMMLFPTEFTLKTTPAGIRLMATPVKEIETLHGAAHNFSQLTAQQANMQLDKIQPGPLHVKMSFALAAGNNLTLRYGGEEILSLSAKDCMPGANHLEVLIDKTVAEIFLNSGDRYIVHQLAGVVPASLRDHSSSAGSHSPSMSPANNKGLEFDSERYGPFLESMQVYEMQSVWGRP